MAHCPIGSRHVPLQPHDLRNGRLGVESNPGGALEFGPVDPFAECLNIPAGVEPGEGRRTGIARAVEQDTGLRDTRDADATDRR